MTHCGCRWFWRERTHTWPLLEELVDQALLFMPPPLPAAAAADSSGDALPLFLMTDANATEIKSLTGSLQARRLVVLPCIHMAARVTVLHAVTWVPRRVWRSKRRRHGRCAGCSRYARASTCMLRLFNARLFQGPPSFWGTCGVQCPGLWLKRWAVCGV